MNEYRTARDRRPLRRRLSAHHLPSCFISPVRIVFPLLFLCCSVIPIPANPVSITFDQTAVFPGWYDADISLKSPFLDGSFAFRGGERLAPPDDFLRDPALPFANPEPRHWSLTARPTRHITVTAGSLSVSGLPARAKNPFFALTDPRYTALSPLPAQIVRAGTTLDSDNLAVECTTDHWKLAAAGDPRSRLDEPAWILAGTSLGSPGARGPKLSVSALYGANTVESKNETSWFRDVSYLPRALIAVSGGEAIFSCGGVSGSVTALSSAGPFRDAEWLFRSDCSLSGRHLSLSGGFSRSSAGFTPLDGNRETWLGRAFIASALALGNHQAGKRAKLRNAGHAGFSVGGMLIRDIERRERFYLDDREVYALGGFCSLGVYALDLDAESATREGKTTLEGKARVGTARFPFSLAGSAKTTVPNVRNGFSLRENGKISAGIAWKSGMPGQNGPRAEGSDHHRKRKSSIEVALTGTETRAKPDDAPEYTLSMALALALTGRNLRFRATAEASVSTGATPWEGKIGLETAYK